MALALAAFTLTLCLGSLAAVHAAYTGKEDRRNARTPVTQASQPDRERATLWLVGSDALEGERRFSVVNIAPHTANAPLPPGIDRWPGPGEVLLSPGLREAGASEGINRRYGELVGTINHEGLEDPGEWLAYVRPPAGMSPERPVERVVGFGPEAGRLAEGLEPGSGRFDDKPEWMFQSLLAGLLLAPSAVLLFVAARAGAHSRDRRTSLVDALGGTRHDRALIAIGDAWRPVLLGALASTPLIAAAMLVDWKVPHTGYLLSSADLRHYGWQALLAPIAATVVALAVVVLSEQKLRRASGTRPYSTLGGRWQRGIAVLCPLAILFAVRGPELAGTNTLYRTCVILTGLIATMVTLPAAVATATAMLGRVLERTGRQRGWPAVLVAGRRASAYPAATARLVTGVIVALIVFMQAIAWQALFGSQNAQLEQALSRIDKSIAEVGPKGTVSADDTAAFLDRLPESSEAVLLTATSGNSSGPITMRGSCPALEGLSLPCPRTQARVDRVPDDPRLQQLLQWNTHGGTYLAVVRTDRTALAKHTARVSEDGVLAVVATDGSVPSAPALKELAYETFPRGAQVRSSGEEWLTASIPNRDQGRWAALFGVAGIGVLVAAAGLMGMAEFLRHGRALAPLSVLNGGYRVIRGTAAWAVLAPLALAGFAGGIVSAWLARPISKPGTTYYIPIGLLVTTVTVVLAVSLVMWLWSTIVAANQARTWRPKGE